MLYPRRREMTNTLPTISLRLTLRRAMRVDQPRATNRAPSAGVPDKLYGRAAIGRRTVGKTWTIGQKTSTHGQDGNRLREAEFVTGRDMTEKCHPYIAASLPRIPQAWRAFMICADRFTHSDLPVRANEIA